MVSEAVANPCLAEFLRRPGDGSRVGVSRETNRHHMGPTPKALIAAARRATTALRDDQAARRNQEARNICGLGDPSIADYGAARAGGRTYDPSHYVEGGPRPAALRGWGGGSRSTSAAGQSGVGAHLFQIVTLGAIGTSPANPRRHGSARCPVGWVSAPRPYPPGAVTSASWPMALALRSKIIAARAK
jgi:hypothetical protein